MAITNATPFIPSSHQALRSTILEDLDAHPHRPVLLHGAPGIGKTTLAATLDPSHCTHVDLQHVDDLDGLIQLVARATSFVQEPSPEAIEQEALLTLLAEHLSRRGQRRTPLVLDHADACTQAVNDLITALTTSSDEATGLECSHPILIIARHTFSLPGNVTARELPRLSRTQGLTFLAHLSPRNWEQDELEAIADAVMHHPHSLAMCSKRLAIFSPRQILDRLEAHPVTRDFPAILQLFAWSWESLDPRAHKLLSSMSVFASRSFTHAMLLEVTPNWSTDTREEALARLLTSGLVQLDERAHGDDPDEVEATFHIERALHDFLSQRLLTDAVLMKHAEEATEHFTRHVATVALNVFDETRGNRWHLSRTSLSPSFEAHVQPTYARALAQWRQVPDAFERTWELAACALLAHLMAWKQQDFRALHTLHSVLSEELMPCETFNTLPLELSASIHLAAADHHYLHYRYQDASQELQPLDHEKLSDKLRLRVEVRRFSFNPASATPEKLEELLDLARQVEDTLLLGEAMLMQAHACIHLRRLKEGLEKLAHTVAFCDARGLPRLMARALVFHGFALHEAGEQQEGDAQLQKAYEVFLAQDDVIGAAHTLRILARQNIDTFELDLASSRIDMMLALADLHGIGWLHSFGHFLQAQYLLETSHREEALVHYERAIYHYERQHNIPLLTITRLYQSICYKLLDRPESARQLFQEAMDGLEHARSVALKLHLFCEEVAWLASDGEHELARERLAQAQHLIAHCDEDDLLIHILRAYEAHAALARFLSLTKRPTRRGDEAKEFEELYSKILRLLSSLYQPRAQIQGRSAFYSCMETRTLWYQIEHMIPSDLMARLQLERQDPDARALIIDTSTRAIRPPGTYTWVSLAKKHNPYRLLEALLTRHLNSPGEPLPAQELIEQVWPEDRITPDAAQNRLHVTLSTLRGAQLKEHIHHHEGGYMLSPELIVLEA